MKSNNKKRNLYAKLISASALLSVVAIPTVALSSCSTKDSSPVDKNDSGVIQESKYTINFIKGLNGHNTLIHPSSAVPGTSIGTESNLVETFFFAGKPNNNLLGKTIEEIKTILSITDENKVITPQTLKKVIDGVTFENGAGSLENQIEPKELLWTDIDIDALVSRDDVIIQVVFLDETTLAITVNLTQDTKYTWENGGKNQIYFGFDLTK